MDAVKTLLSLTVAFRFAPRQSAAALLVGGLLQAASLCAGEIRFEDVSGPVGLNAIVANHQLAHGAAWGDVDGDGRPDLYMGAFADRPVFREPGAPIPNLLLLNTPGGFVMSEDKGVRFDGDFARTTMALFVDLDNDRDLDLYVGNNIQSTNKAWGSCPSRIFENTGKGRYRPVDPQPSEYFKSLAVRNVAPLDVDWDGRLDQIMTDGHYRHLRSSSGRLIVLRNTGGWTFEFASDRLGLPPDGTAGLGLALGDVNNDGRLDIFVAQSNRLLLSTPEGKFQPWQDGTFSPSWWKDSERRDERLPCGAAFGDLNGDDRLDLVFTVHGQPTQIFLFMNETTDTATPRFVYRSEEAGLAVQFPRNGITGLQVKTAHVELQDMDNDGRKDIYIANTFRDAKGRVQPMVLHNLGIKDGVPLFSRPPVEQLVSYYCAAPLADFDRDGDLDIYMGSWSEAAQAPCYLFRNDTPGGHWLEVKVIGSAPPFNSMGIGAVVRAYRTGHAGEPKHLLARHDMAIGVGYSSGQEALAHMGLGQETACDLTVSWQGSQQTLRNVSADRLIEVRFEPRN